MGILSWLGYEKRSSFRDSIGRTTSAGVAVTDKTALSFTAVWACVRVISESIASLPIHVYEENADGDIHIAKANPLNTLVSREPNGFMTSYTWRINILINTLIHGNAYFKIERDSSERPISLTPYNSEDVTPVLIDGVLFYNVKDVETPIVQSEMLHFMGIGYHGIKGESVLKVFADTIGLSLAANKTAASYFGNAAQILGVLMHPGKLKQEAVETLRNGWDANYGGVNKVSKTAILQEGVEFKPINIPATDRQLLESRLFQVQEIARIFRVPPSMIADLSKANYNSMEQLSIDFVRNTLTPYVVGIEAELNRKLFRESEKSKMYVKIKVEGLLRGDSAARSKFYRDMLQTGVFSINEVRRLEDLNAIDGGDEHFVPLNFAPLGEERANEE